MQEISFDDPKAIIAYARDLGFEFDEKDLEEFGGNMLERSDELSEGRTGNGGWRFCGFDGACSFFVYRSSRSSSGRSDIRNYSSCERVITQTSSG